MRFVSAVVLMALPVIACGGDEASAPTTTVAPATTTTSTTTPVAAAPEFAPSSIDEADFAYAATLTLAFEAVLLEIGVESDDHATNISSDIVENMAGEPFETSVVDGIGYSSEAGGPFVEDEGGSVADLLSDLDILR